eukprot:tig00020710_g13239.t1
MGNSHPVIKAKHDEEEQEAQLDEHAMEVMARVRRMFEEERARHLQPPNLLAYPVKERKAVLRAWHKRTVLHRLRDPAPPRPRPPRAFPPRPALGPAPPRPAPLSPAPPRPRPPRAFPPRPALGPAPPRPRPSLRRPAPPRPSQPRPAPPPPAARLSALPRPRPRPPRPRPSLRRPAPPPSSCPPPPRPAPPSPALRIVAAPRLWGRRRSGAARQVRRRREAGREDADLRDVIADAGRRARERAVGHVDFDPRRRNSLKRASSFKWDQALGLQKFVSMAGAAAAGAAHKEDSTKGGIGEGRVLALAQALGQRQTRPLAIAELLEHSENAFRAREIVQAGALEPLGRIAAENGAGRLEALTIIRNVTRGDPEAAKQAARALKIDEILRLIETSLDDLDVHQMAYNILKNMTESAEIARLFVRGGFHAAVLNDLLNPFIQNEYRVAPAAVLANLLRLEPIPRGVIDEDVLRIVKSMIQHPMPRVHLQGIRCAKHLSRDQEALRQLVELHTAPLLVSRLGSGHDEVVMEAVSALANYARSEASHGAMAAPESVRTLVILSRAGRPRIERGAVLALSRLARNKELRPVVESQEGLFALLPYAQLEPTTNEERELREAASQALWPGAEQQRQQSILQVRCVDR